MLMELSETELYYYGARYYNPSVSTWLSVDPMSARDPSQTPYHFVLNSPVMLIDPTGLTWENPEEDKKTENFLVSQFERVRNSFQRKANRLSSRADKLSANGKEHRADRKSIKANYYQRGADEMQTAITELRDMGSENNPQVFSLNQALNATNKTKRESNGTIGIYYNQISDLVHELTHAYDISKGNIIAQPGASGGDLTSHDELKAYRRVWFFSPNAFKYYRSYEGPVRNLIDINYKWLINIYDYNERTEKNERSYIHFELQKRRVK